MDDEMAISKTVLDMQDNLRQHMEEFAAAFCKYTNLPPDRVVMMIEQKYTERGFVQKVWFEEKT